MTKRILRDGFFVRGRRITCDLCSNHVNAGICKNGAMNENERICICLKCAAAPFSVSRSYGMRGERMDHASVLEYLDLGRLRYESSSDTVSCDNCREVTPATVYSEREGINICLLCARKHTDLDDKFGSAYAAIERKEKEDREKKEQAQREREREAAAESARKQEFVSRALRTGVFIYPASKAYGGRGARCDLCYSSKLCAVIHFGDEDVCLTCALETPLVYRGLLGRAAKPDAMSSEEMLMCLQTARLRYAGDKVDGSCDNCEARTNTLLYTGGKDLCIPCCLKFCRSRSLVGLGGRSPRKFRSTKF